LASPIVPIGLSIDGELRFVDRELPLGKSTFCISRRHVREEELKEPRIAKLRRRTRRSIKPGAQSGPTRWRNRKDASTSTLGVLTIRGRKRADVREHEQLLPIKRRLYWIGADIAQW
jgi:hypothetical protein